jgi:D-beta-D-heptose 7-phosphate kinase/D-beta-D-heptose 1-phosphate adenosyltransferase
LLVGHIDVGEILSRDKLVERVTALKEARRRIVFTNGCFDLLHPGHIVLLEKCRSMGDVLIVGMNSDRSVEELKGPGRPLLPEQERAEVLAALAAVDFVSIFDEPTPRELVAAVLPHVLVKGADWGAYIVGRDDVEASGGQVISLQLEAGWSTSALVETVVERFGSGSKVVAAATPRSKVEQADPLPGP